MDTMEVATPPRTQKVTPCDAEGDTSEANAVGRRAVRTSVGKSYEEERACPYKRCFIVNQRFYSLATFSNVPLKAFRVSKIKAADFWIIG